MADDLSFQDFRAQPGRSNPQYGDPPVYDAETEAFFADESQQNIGGPPPSPQFSGSGAPQFSGSGAPQFPGSEAPQFSKIPEDASSTPILQSELSPEAQNFKFYHLSYYRPYFDVDTKDVLFRIGKTLVPLGNNFFETINPTPDLYGPFWIATTVIFLMAATGNFSEWIKAAIDGTTSSFYFDYTKLSSGAITLYLYIVLMPLIVWGVCKWLDIKLTLLENWCIYGYAFFVYIPASFTMIIPLSWLQWPIMIIACTFSTVFLVRNYLIPCKTALFRGFVLVAVIALIHIGLSLGFKFYFFSLYTVPSNNNSTANPFYF